MDYIYSCLNDDVASREMHGSETNTAVVTVNAATNTISVDVKPISPSMLNVTKPTETGSYILQETISEIGEVSYSWATLEDYNQEVTQAIANLTQQLEQEKQERIESVQDEANTRELADTQLRNEFTSEITQAVSEEAQRTDSMIKQLNGNVQEGFNTINNVLTTSINNINNAILNESTVREEQYQDTEFRIRDLNTRLGVEIDNRKREDGRIHASLSAYIEKEKMERVEQDQDIRNSISAEANAREEAFDELSNKISSEANRTDNMINQLNNNVQEGFNILNTVLIDSINTINGGIEEERQTRATADETLQSNIDAEANERKSVDQHLWDILPDNIIAGTPMQGMENANAINIVFSKYQKHGIGEDPADAELVEVPNQAITLFPATQEVAGVLTAADKTKIDNIATDIKTAVQAETNRATNAENALDEKINTTKNDILGDVAESYNTLGKLEDAIQDEASTRSSADTQLQNSINAEADARQEADTALENKLDSLIVVEGDAIQVGREDKELNIKTGGRFTVNSNYEVVTSEEYPGEPGRRIIPLENNDQIAGKKTDGNGVPLVFVSKWDKVEVGGKGAPLNLNSNDGKVTVNDEHTLLDETDKQDLTDAIEAEETRATTQEEALQQAIDTEKSRAEAKESELNTAIQNEAAARSTADTQIHEELDAIDTRVGNLEGKTTRLFYGDGTVASPTKEEINNFVTTLPVEPPYTAPFEGIAVVVHRTDENTYHIWHYYSNTNAWQDDGVDTVSTFTNSVRGIIQGSTNDGYVAAENGLGKVSGWDTVKTDITNLQNNLSSNVSNINNSISNINQNVANIANDLAANVVILGDAYTQANSAYAQANTAINIATNATNITAGYLATKRIADGLIVSGNSSTTAVSKNSETGAYTVTAIVNKENVGLGNVPNVDTTNASNINSGTLEITRINGGLIEGGANISVTRNEENGVYTISATTGGVVPIVSVAGKKGPEVVLNSISFTIGACTATYNGESDVTVDIPTVPTLHSVSISTNNGSATTVAGNVYSNSDTPIEITVPKQITVANTYGINSSSNGIVTGISFENGVLTVSYGALDDGTL